MEKRKLAYLTFVIGFFVLLLAPTSALAGPEDIVVVDVIEEDVLIRGRTAYYTYRLQVTNNGNSLTNVAATVSSQTRAIRVTKSTLQFGDLGSNVVLASSDTFTIRVSSQTLPDLSQLIYTFTGDEVTVSDVIAPTITAQLSNQANSNGWHNEPVVVSFQCNDNVAIESCTDDVTVSIDGANQVVSGTAIDTSGNTATTQIIINLDTQAPEVSASLSDGSDTPPADNATLLQRISIDAVSEANTALELYQIGSQNILLGSLQTNAAGEATLENLDLPIGNTSFLLRGIDIADNQNETEVSFERLQCLTQATAQNFYIDTVPTNGSDAGLLLPDDNSFSGQYEQFSGNADGLVQVVPGFINNDVLSDWIVLDGSQFGVTVSLNSGNGIYNAGTFLSTGGSIASAAVLADLVDSAAIDLAVGHSDGSVAIFTGDGDGGFSSTPTETFNHSGTITALQSADLDQDGDIDLLVATATQLYVYFRDNDSVAQSVITNGQFTNGLVAWQVEVVGHQQGQQAGQVINAGSGAQLFENESFLVSLSQGFTPSSDAPTLSFNLFSVFLDSADGGIPDALEVSLLDGSKQSAVPTFRPEASSFLNISADGTVNTATGVTYAGGNVELDISAVDSPVTLYFDLIGNPPGTGSSFIVSNVNAGETIMVNNDYTTSVIDDGLLNANGAVFCDAVSSNPPILVSDPGSGEIKIYQQDASGNFVLSTSLAQGGE